MNRMASDVSTQLPQQSAEVAMRAMPWWRAGWERWKKIAHAVGVVQTRFLMVSIYLVMVLPLGLLTKRKEDRLRLRPPKGSLWLPHPETEHTLDRARRQF